MTKRELFNDVYFQSQSCDSVFSKFPYLPRELRQMIWSHSLRRRRWIPLRVVLPTDYLSYVDYGQSREKYLRTPYYGARNSLGKIISGWDYHLAVDKEDSTLSPLFGVSSEARQIALEFYRVRVPVRQCLSLSSGRDLRLNPEYDVVFLKWAYRSYLIADVLHDIKAHDPQDVGVVHLALNEGFCDYLDKLSCESPGGFPDIKYGLSLSTLHQVARESLAEMVRSKIQSIFYMVNFLWDRVWNPVAGISHPLTGTRGSGLFMLHHARGRPLDRHLDSATFFDWLPRDLRPVDADLGMVRLWDDPHRLSEWWTRLEALFGADGWWQTHPRPDFYLCPSTRWSTRFHGYEPCVGGDQADPDLTRERLELYLDDEARRLDEACEYAAVCHQWKGGRRGFLLDQATYERLQVELRDVVGMWVLRPDAYVDHENRTDPLERSKRCYDVSAAWPGLVVFEKAVV
ncbi:hypothetical protein MCOR27_010834 [Pyricularia oryzae]|nr:hypothetical protein MCOR27_010834 [Pyricularia oryzae]KAI6406890.1 hypothetical protein MCOR23_002066 [Pyricularia oryzae]KAI6465250.1 hypothetical protein MCOR15_003430 [Pyricularia oryzae]KAI6490714.1 hypothetical protein MCOR11_007386 [Pyricularia oryzae]KAI6523923.1 hypothetical protein MCOR05_009903 [Pyricularia oryzae]